MERAAGRDKMPGGGIVLLAGLLAVSCAAPQDRQAAPAAVGAPQRWDPLPGLARLGAQGTVVARVNGTPILSVDVHARASQRGLGTREALDQLIGEELVFQEAVQGSTPRDRDQWFRSAAAYKLLEKDFEAKNTPQAIDEKSLRAVFNEIQAAAFSKTFGRLKFIFGHQEWRLPLQLIIKKRVLKTRDEAASARAMFTLVKSWFDDQPQPSPELFRQSAWTIQGSFFPVDFENRYAPVSMKWEENFYRIGVSFDAKFKEALFRIPAENGTSPAFFTQHGVHWVFYQKNYPAVHHDFEEIRANLREKLSLSFRSRAFAKWIKGLRSKYGASLVTGEGS